MHHRPDLLPQLDHELATPSTTPLAVDRLVKAIIHNSTLKVDILLVLIVQVTALILISFLLHAAVIGFVGISLRTAVYAYGVIALLSLVALVAFIRQWFRRDDLI